MRPGQISTRFRILLTTIALVAPAWARGGDAPDARLGSVDFRYAPPWWQSAICLPDDPDKILVGKEGQVLLDFGRGGVRNFGVVLMSEIDTDITWLKQQTSSPRAPIVQTFQKGAGVELLDEAFVVIPDQHLPARRVVVLGTLRNTSTATARRQPRLRISSSEPVRSDQGEAVLVGSDTAHPGLGTGRDADLGGRRFMADPAARVDTRTRRVETGGMDDRPAQHPAAGCAQLGPVTRQPRCGQNLVGTTLSASL